MTTYLLRTVLDIPRESKLDLSGKLARTVRNTGNYFFEHAVSRQLDEYEVVSSVEMVPNGAEKLILSMSNFLSPATDMGNFARELEKKNIKQIVMIGAGAQAHSYEDSISLSKGTQRFLSLLSDKSETIGIRGFYTKKILEDYNVYNGEVIGCPSIFYDLDREFRISKKPLPDDPRLAFHMTPTGHYRDNISHLISIGVKHATSYIAQSENDLISVSDNPVIEDEDIEYMFKYYNDGTYSPREIRDWFSKHCNWFFDLDSWFAHMKTMDFSVGARFHGNMAALQSGVPALNLIFDTRTREMCEFLNLPIMFLKDLTGRETIDELYDRADYRLFNSTYKKKYDNYVGFLSRNKVATTLTKTGSEGTQPRTGVHADGIMRLLHEIDDSTLEKPFILDLIQDRFKLDRNLDVRKLAEAKKYDVATFK